MAEQPIAPWLTEKYAKELNEKHKEYRKLKPYSKEEGEEMKKRAEEEGLRYRKEMEAKIKEIGKEAYIKEAIEKNKELIYKLKNPTPEEKYKYTEAYFKDLIDSLEQGIASFELMLKDIREEGLIVEDLLQIPKTKYPNEYIVPKDKISNMLFNGELSEELKALRMERIGSKKELTAKVSIGFEELQNVKLSNRSITQYDREVHDAIVSLYVDGENEYITPLMIYRTMTGNPNAKLTDKIFNDISEAIERCSLTRVYIDATGEVEGKGYNIEKPIYKENLLYVRSVKGLHNGEMGEWLQIIQPPILYKYANSKNQVARMDIKLLNTPVNKNEETIILQGYLQRRILSMKGSSLSRNILYETVYKQLDINATSPGALRKKQTKIRDTIKNILEYWKEERFIKDFKENIGPNNSKLSISIILD